MEYSDVSGNNYGSMGGRYASYILRISAVNLNDFKSEIGKFSNVVRSSEQVEDVTLNYVDTESRIAALNLEQESLMRILEKAEDRARRYSLLDASGCHCCHRPADRQKNKEIQASFTENCRKK